MKDIMYKPTTKTIKTTPQQHHKANKLYKDDYILNNDANKTVYKQASELGLAPSIYIYT
jgi:hypothetical protein